MKKKKDKTEGPQGIFGTTENPDGNIPSEGGKASRGSGKKEKALSVAGKVIWGIFVLVTLFNTIYFLQEDEYGVIRTLGNTQIVETPGMKFKIPYFQQVIKVSKAAKQFSVGYDLESDVSVEGESFMITSDYNFVNVDFYFEYQITDPVKYLYASETPETVVKNLAQSYIRDTVGTCKVDDVLTTGKYQIQTSVREQLQERLQTQGITCTQATISRDIKQLHLIKEPVGQGRYRYTVSSQRNRLNVADKLRTIFRESIISVDFAQNIVVVKTMAGLANAAAAALDGMNVPYMVGTLAGDDTAFLLMRDTESARTFCEEIHEMLR